MIDISELMDDPDFASTITVTRAGVGAFVGEGIWAQGSSITFDMTAIVQPASAEDMAEFLADGEREKGAKRVWSAAPLIMADGKGMQSDLFVHEGLTYRVAFSKPWELHGYSYSIGVSYVPG